MSITRTVELVLTAIGVTLMILGCYAANSVSGKIGDEVTGRFAYLPMVCLIAGMAVIAGGVIPSIWIEQRARRGLPSTVSTNRDRRIKIRSPRHITWRIVSSGSSRPRARRRRLQRTTCSWPSPREIASVRASFHFSSEVRK